ncbi:uncharacterized protein LOC117301485 isoform X2 [Asterias rubens]|uniref:uncharacterized protein LOC117301485 isoform X2 n=1 Tax=Asterias rubens TaxID=7604 RepID=UPI001455D779|nr:uncharacterized protein LOC117301485 isoform X2 [Asterias rubens]
MVLSCCCCKNRFRSKEGLKFFRFPDIRSYQKPTPDIDNNPVQNKAWTDAVSRRQRNNRHWKPSRHDRICSDHFVSGNYSKHVNHVDNTPSVFSSSTVAQTSKGVQDLNRYLRLKKRSALKRRLDHDDDVQLQDEPSTNSSTPAPMLEPDPVNNIPMPSTPKRLKEKTRESSSQTTQTTEDKDPHDMYRNEIVSLKSHINSLQSQVDKLKWSNDKIKSNSKCKFYTGLPTYLVFLWLFQQLVKGVSPSYCKCLNLKDQLLLVLMKLRLDLAFNDIAGRFQISRSSASKIFHLWMKHMSVQLKPLINWPDRQTLRRTLPKTFKKSKKYRKTTVIIDCFEIFMQRPSDLKLRAHTYSHYKHHNTIKVLIGISPTGAVMFLSKCFGGRVSDKKITQKSGFYEKLLPGDLILADRGFTISDELAIHNAILAIPAFTKGKNQLSGQEVAGARSLSNVRIHVERAIGRLKEFHILQHVVPITLVKSIDEIVTVCAALTNLLPDLVK